MNTGTKQDLKLATEWCGTKQDLKLATEWCNKQREEEGEEFIKTS